MYAPLEKKEKTNRPIHNSIAQKKSEMKKGFGFVDNLHESVHQKNISQMVHKTGRYFSGSRETLQLYKNITRNDNKANYKCADDDSVAVDSKHILYAEQKKIKASNATLQGLNSGIELQVVNDKLTTPEPIKNQLYKVLAKNKQNSTQGDTMKLWEDCGRSSAQVMGNSNRSAKITDPKDKSKKITASGTGNTNFPDFVKGMDYAKSNPAGMKIEIFQEEMLHIYKNFENQRGTINQYLKNKIYPLHKAMVVEVSTIKGTNGKVTQQYWTLLRELSDQYLDWHTKYMGSNNGDKYLGINYAASPEVGEGYAISSGGKASGGSQWPFHWAGVVMESNNKSDKVTLENAADGGGYNNENTKWKFEMYGTEKEDQTFHHLNKKDGYHDMNPTTMVVKGN